MGSKVRGGAAGLGQSVCSTCQYCLPELLPLRLVASSDARTGQGPLPMLNTAPARPPAHPPAVLCLLILLDPALRVPTPSHLPARSCDMKPTWGYCLTAAVPCSPWWGIPPSGARGHSRGLAPCAQPQRLACARVRGGPRGNVGLLGYGNLPFLFLMGAVAVQHFSVELAAAGTSVCSLQFS